MTAGGMAMMVAGLAALPALAAATDPAAERVLAPFAACRTVSDPAQRGPCYDRALAGLRDQVAAGEVVITDATRRRAQFGLGAAPVKTARVAKAAAAPAMPTEVDEIDSTVVSTRSTGYERLQIELADGAVWRTTEPSETLSIASGTKVHLKRGILGSYLLQPARGRAVKVLRVR